ncbi:YhcG family protein [Kribbella sp. NPDC059898]|uniref:PDDEXK nuclease domain-containing protein n=1 Tax=Kribbella sp. NPDC059898 TaxID=3346995 RepID=UPI00365A6074
MSGRKKAVPPAETSRTPVRGETSVPADYGVVLERIKVEVRTARVRAQHAVSIEMLELYRRIGTEILAQQQAAGWGAKIIEQLAKDLAAEFPDTRGFSRSNLYYMRAFAASWPRPEVVPRDVGQLPWRYVRTLLDKLDDAPTREWYATQAVEHTWSLEMLETQIALGLQRRLGAAPTNFVERLPAPEAQLLQQITKDPYVFDFLDLTPRKLEHDVEQALMDHLQATLTEFGRGFAFLGRQVSFDVDGDEYTVDLLLFHTHALAHVVVELKIGKFKPADAGQLGFYVAMVDDKLRKPAIHAPTVGILLCASRNEAAVRYALRNNTSPLAVANFTDAPGLENLDLPDLDELTAILEEPFDADHTLADALPDEPIDN